MKAKCSEYLGLTKSVEILRKGIEFVPPGPVNLGIKVLFIYIGLKKNIDFININLRNWIEKSMVLKQEFILPLL